VTPKQRERRDAAILALREQGLTGLAIAQRLNLPLHIVCRILRDNAGTSVSDSARS
jgi:hypothetical protein